ncbi:MAG: hypothetical protein WC164_01325 [Patescibacteria group bacterium]|jgi:hypothetical protein
MNINQVIDLPRLAEEKNLSLKKIIEIIDFSQKTGPIFDSFAQFSLPINKEKSLSDLLRDGKYNLIGNRIDSMNLEKTKKKIVELKIFDLRQLKPRDSSSETICLTMKDQGFKASNFLELLHLGAIYPDLQRRFPIVALGSICIAAQGRIGVPYLTIRDYQRMISLNFFNYSWKPQYKFLGTKID